MNTHHHPTAAPPISLSVIVPAFNEEKLIAESLQTIRAALDANRRATWLPGARAPFDYELIVCNNNSTDRTGELAAAAGAKVVFEPVNQIARARNCGASAATGDWLLFIDADSYPSPGLIGDLIAAIRAQDSVGGGALVAMQNIPFSAELVLRFWNAISAKARWAAGSFVFCRRDGFQAIGGFSQELYAAEEIDFSKRLTAWGAERGLRFRILETNPLLTSERKTTLYSKAEHARMLWRNLVAKGAGVRSKETCHIWYDGRR
ncbi:MAG TPA: glycosyltransferase [Planctomycetota bacterium]|nr:glycosyltransferase [Planctomycetota bacterium]